jgi:hypothetical protein
MMTEPEVSVPAVMRNYYEVLRNDLAKVLAPLAAAGDLAGFVTAWDSYCAAIAVHAAMEDGVEGSGGGSAAMLDYYCDVPLAPRFSKKSTSMHMPFRPQSRLRYARDPLRYALRLRSTASPRRRT